MSKTDFKMIFTTIDEIKGILFVKYIGNISLAEIKKFFLNERTVNNINGKLKILTDARKAKFNLSINDISDLADYNKHYLKNYQMVNEAILIDSPKETALSVIYQKLSQNYNYRFEIFNERASALNWLNKIEYKEKAITKAEFSQVLLKNAKKDLCNNKTNEFVQAV